MREETDYLGETLDSGGHVPGTVDPKRSWILQRVGQVLYERLLTLGEAHEPGFCKPTGEVDLMIVNVLPEIVPARNHDRLQPSSPTVHQRPGSGMADDRCRPAHRLLHLFVPKARDPRDVAGRDRCAGLDEAVNVAATSVIPAVYPAAEAVKGVMIGTDYDKYQRAQGLTCFVDH